MIKTLLLALTMILVSPSAVALKSPLWDCPYSNFLVDEAGHCISLDYLVQWRQPLRRHPFPDWLITLDPQYLEVLRGKITSEIYLGDGIWLNGVENRWALVTMLPETIEPGAGAKVGFIDCFTGWSGTYELPAGATDLAAGTNNFIPPEGSEDLVGDRRICQAARIGPQF